MRGLDSYQRKYKNEVSALEQRRSGLLIEKEATWRLKSRALWFSKGDENSKLFYLYANHKKNINIVWKVNMNDGLDAENYEDIAKCGVEHFKGIYKEDERVIIVEVIRKTYLFPRFIVEEDNNNILEELSKDKLYILLHSLQKDKILSPNGWSVEFSYGFMIFWRKI